ncbi:MAG: serine/threonine protein kinase [Proteobacteria bacterium]|nr:serine/threonine protein kinase [Pseudomonadota bacterium]
MAKAKYYGQYKVTTELGRGGMAVVYKCWEESLSRFVAIKVLSEHLINNKELKERFLREAKSMAAINHPNVIQVHFIGEQDGLPYFAMEYIDGKSLSDILMTDTCLTIKHAKNLLFQACEGLLAAHKIDLIHRDIKPGNLMISGEGLLKLVDFGIAQSHNFEKRLTSTGDLVGTPGYLPPEACLGETLDLRADIYSLGIVFYQMLAGRIPFENTSPLGLLQEVSNSNILDIRKINKKVDAKTANLLEKMVARDPNDRFQNCKNIIALLERPLKNNTIKAMIKARSQSTNFQIRTIENSKITLINNEVPNKEKAETKSEPNKRPLPAILAIFLLILVLFYFREVFNPTVSNSAITNPDFVSNLEGSATDKLSGFQESLDKSADAEAQDLSVLKNASNTRQCLEVGPFKLVDNKPLSAKKLKQAKLLLKKLRQLTINYLAKQEEFNVYASGQKACLNNRQPLLLNAEVKQGKLSKILSSSGLEKRKVNITLTLINKNTNIQLAQKRLSIKNLAKQLEQTNSNQDIAFIQDTLVFIQAAIGD